MTSKRSFHMGSQNILFFFILGIIIIPLLNNPLPKMKNSPKPHVLVLDVAVNTALQSSSKDSLKDKPSGIVKYPQRIVALGVKLTLCVCKERLLCCSLSTLQVSLVG